MEQKVVVRFAPSPTGYLHVGGARTAIFNWLYARKTGGKFILRIEDTDTERSVEDAIGEILDGLRWMGLDWDQGPDFQSRHIGEHREAARKLLASGRAYKCFCSKEDLDRKRETARQNKETFRYDGTCRQLSPDEIAEKEASGLPFTVRLKVPDGSDGVRFTDAVYGTIEKKYADIEDFVIVRSNGQPLYMLSNAVDDIRDGVTHIIRGQDGLANTPKQILIYDALGAPLPVFAHMSLALDPNRAKISKRKHGEKVAVRYYREQGFLPWALVNFLVLLGWSTPESREIFSKEELISAFSFEGISRNNPVFDLRKDDPRFFTDPRALSINAHYLRTLPVEEIAPFVKEQLENAGIWDTAFEGEEREWFLKTTDLIRSRFQVTTDFVTLGRAYFSDDYPIDPKALRKNVLKHRELAEWLPVLANGITEMEEYGQASLEAICQAVPEESGMKPGVLMNGVRTILTGQAVGPGFFEILEILGPQTVADRLARAVTLFRPEDLPMIFSDGVK
ncbi:glutamate--tRNA ligase [Desulfonema ishimotonii]|uniref:Glutamate--tRNA ligase n=1 Tax=Desulfonema ishimotonii TaxID=45657 RepID=A0A401G2S8_9BACT|nr:glutamate--tRNA ligase [Desulfonema ishimotonii]GBC63548.1 glutamate--tRNA ligase [Desulfonema ishimotonii]